MLTGLFFLGLPMHLRDQKSLASFFSQPPFTQFSPLFGLGGHISPETTPEYRTQGSVFCQAKKPVFLFDLKFLQIPS